MIRTFFHWGSILGIFLGATSVLQAEEITIQVHLFQGAWGEGHAGLTEVTVLTGASHPAIEALRAKVGGTEAEMIATIDALIESQELKTVDDVFGFAMNWDGHESELNQDVTHKTLGAFSFTFRPRRLSPQDVELSIVIDKSKGSASKDEKAQLTEVLRARREGRLEKILDTKLRLKIDDPVIIGIPVEPGAFFLMIRLASPQREPHTKSAARTKPAAKQSAVTGLKPIHTVTPAYPEELRREGVQGQVEAQVAIDEEGAVLGVGITRSLHPYLDFAAVQALRQWKFEPIIQNGKPIPVTVTLVVKFDPETYRLFEEKTRNQEGAPAGKATSPEKLLRKILDQSAEYCQKLAGAALDFICEERIKEVHYNFAKNPKWSGVAVAPKGGGGPVWSTSIPEWDPVRTEKYDYTCDYLFVKKGDRTEERRIVLKDNGRTMPDRNRFLEEKRFTALNPLMAAIQILGRDRQPLFNFRLIDTDSIHGRKAQIIEAIPRSGNTWGVEYAKIWVDQKGSQVLKSEIQGVPLEGYDDVLRDTTQFSIKPILTTTHTYEVEKQGVFFPTHTVIRVEYPEPISWLTERVLKLKIDMAYDQYKFFTVETESNVKK
jgi:TonB family protein